VKNESLIDKSYILKELTHGLTLAGLSNQTPSIYFNRKANISRHRWRLSRTSVTRICGARKKRSGKKQKKIQSKDKEIGTPWWLNRGTERYQNPATNLVSMEQTAKHNTTHINNSVLPSSLSSNPSP
jgi:hypothetical protein